VANLNIILFYEGYGKVKHYSTLIMAAVGVYDSQNFEQILLKMAKKKYSLPYIYSSQKS
jgi:hypothetical protein